MTTKKLSNLIHTAKSKANINFKKGPLDSGEIETLQQLVVKYGTDWDEITKCMPDRSRKQLQNTLGNLKLTDMRKSGVYENSGKFKPEEDKIVLEMIAADSSYGLGTRIGDALGRAPASCIERITTLNTNDLKRKGKL
jgi:hypothetical protein